MRRENSDRLHVRDITASYRWLKTYLEYGNPISCRPSMILYRYLRRFSLLRLEVSNSEHSGDLWTISRTAFLTSQLILDLHSHISLLRLGSHAEEYPSLSRVNRRYTYDDGRIMSDYVRSASMRQRLRISNSCQA